ncbi:Hypothetical predicted protein [Olea europaea subsp. europaea]|uniref:Uncharacterized protein n=1 Tax=Olea europaea subsp. europaea TaxID=158383 RepID=A0A8S0TQB6_OLEEU|nr:Hypothetical predicted protein [Olea europaea subsp. europaea]
MKAELGLVELNLIAGTSEEDRVAAAIENSNDNALPPAVIVGGVNVLADIKPSSCFAWSPGNRRPPISLPLALPS